MALGCAVYLAHRMMLMTQFAGSDLVPFFQRLARDGALPEYGPVANAYLGWCMALAQQSQMVVFVMAAKAAALMVDAWVTLTLMRAGPWPLFMWLGGTMALGQFVLDRLDIHTAGLALWSLQGPGVGMVAWALAGLMKFPMTGMAGVAWVCSPGRTTLRFMLGCAALALGVSGSWWVMVGMEGSFSPLFYHGARTPQVEGLVGAALYSVKALWGEAPLGLINENGWHLVGGSAGANVVLRLMALGVLVGAVLWTARRLWRSDAPLAHATLAALAAFTAFNPVGSPQLVLPVLAVACAVPVGPKGIPRTAAWLVFASALLAGVATRQDPSAAEPQLLFGVLNVARHLVMGLAWHRLLKDVRPAA